MAIWKEMKDGNSIVYICDNCGFNSNMQYNYCPDCGFNMKNNQKAIDDRIENHFRLDRKS